MARICTPDARWLIALIALTLTSGSAISPQREAYRRGEMLWRHGDWRGAETALRSLLADAPERDSDDVWQIRLWLGDALTAQAKYKDAADVLAPLPPARLQHSAIAISRFLELAVLEFRLKQGDGAEHTLLDNADALARRYHPELRADVFGRRAIVDMQLNDYAACERDAQQSVRLAHHEHHRIFEINALGTLGSLRTRQRRFDEALAYYRHALSLAIEADARSKIEKVSGNIGWTLILLGDFDGASEVLTRALAIAQEIGAEYDTVSWLDNLGKISRHNRQYGAALTYYEKCVVVARRIGHPNLVEFVTDQATGFLEFGDTAAARKANEEVRTLIKTKKRGEAPGSLEARIDAASGNVGLAINKIQHVITAAGVTDRWEAEARLAEFLLAAKKPSEAAEQFSQALKTASEARGSITSEELRLSFGALVRQFNEEYVELLLSQGRIDAALDIVETSRAQALDEALDTSAALRHIDPMLVAADRHATILSYWLTPNRSYVWTVTSNGVEVTPLGPGIAIEKAVDAYSRELVALRPVKDSKTLGADLYAKLVPPVAKQIPHGARVIVIPDGRLQTFNLETLVEPGTNRYWIENVTVETTASMSLLNRPRTDPRNDEMLLVGDPPSPSAEFPSLANAADEITRIKKHFPSNTILQGARATPRAYRNVNAGRFGLIHFVAHGIASRLRPLESAVVLANDGNSYKLYARDIIKQKLHARLVTISSCHGAGTRAYTGEGLVGLAWAFLHAGAHQVIAALWEVDDNATPTLMDDLYTGIRAGQDPATALRKAKLNLIYGGSAFRQPKYWAPFVLNSGS